ncbi:LOW QUALITY PROTEIN: uncharacterized protein C20orf173 homolog [Lepus europaeus]|uniref:LOW QUALITY PROTEIN: uncharacterized protein C20orf173 homolog n=1 Tax=Lepus europaeus TaxID=9983 RepID=UPI002B499F55|nr:LOW QUALITY PROTEIN: uncharacterized protein C20orf173 homolog [Lepus europaeus]
MKRWQLFVLWVFWVLTLWIMAPYLDLSPESTLQKKQMDLVPWRCNCSWSKFGKKCGCPPGTLNCSSCCHTVGEWNWFDGCYKKTMGYLIRTNEHTTSDPVVWWLIRVRCEDPNHRTAHCPCNASDQGSWGQPALQLLERSPLVWISDALSDEVLEDGLAP